MYHAMKTHAGLDVKLHAILTSALDGCEWSVSRSCRFTPGVSAFGTVRWMVSRGGLDVVAERKESNPGRLYRSQPLYPQLSRLVLLIMFAASCWTEGNSAMCELVL
jgi:hypothetical protein